MSLVNLPASDVTLKEIRRSVSVPSLVNERAELKKRIRPLTEKGIQWQMDRNRQHLRNAISSWRKQASKLEIIADDCSDVGLLRTTWNEICTALDCVQKSFHDVETCGGLDEDFRVKVETIEEEHLHLLRRTGNRIRLLELDDQGSHISRQSSRRSFAKSEVASERSHRSRIETLQAQIKHSELEEQKRHELLKIQSELKRLQLNKELEIVQAELLDDVVYVDKDQMPMKSESRSDHAVHPKALLSCDTYESLVQNLLISRLPIPEPAIFDGSSLQYPSWKAAFTALISHHKIPNIERLYYLKKYVRGEAKECIEGCFLISTENSFDEAMSILEERFGSPFAIVSAFRDKLSKWPKVSGSDGTGLLKLSDFLNQIKAAMSCYPGLNILNDERENQNILHKLPDWLIARWGRMVVERKAKGSFPTFNEFAEFLSKEAKIASDPVVSVQSLKQRGKEGPKGDKRLSSFFLNDNERHQSKDCLAKKTCQTCNKLHPTSLHKTPRQTSSTGPHTSSLSFMSETVDRDKTSMIVPVWLSHTSEPEKECLVYALLDTQSDTTFVSDSVVKDLDMTGTPTNLRLSTMTTSATIKTNRMTGLQIRGYRNDEKIMLPVTYTRKSIPANRDHIPTYDTARKWPYLSGMADSLPPLLDVDIGLLVGYNCPKALLPTEVIAPQGNGPFAQKTVLGWGIVGIVEPLVEESLDPIGVSHRVLTYRSSVDKVSFAVRNSVKEVVTDTAGDLEAIAPSRLDRQFLDIMEKGCKKSDNGVHYEMPLPFRNGKPRLPSNRDQALSRLMTLKKRFVRDPDFKKDYYTFMNDILSNEYAERVPIEDLDKGGSWYIPHHGVYHPNKPKKIRVVFDCAARHQNRCLNDELLTGPDMMNSLF
ncbi:uncharacterized protein LOC106162063 [Lingula anatina]|uniref:Uncharacterized protein LOC106162063 n=1 Tax=Lingula anatina TaxID=7574 RepID=A0A1S3I8W5_LINAN|nr:uncharacterized protein LOC106162063 [Lingula anatina]|eukprot:XP_013394628.1 uncharacterized protein LOC106162063 [Lingula anatina]